MSFEKHDDLANLLQALQNLPEPQRNAILSDARILPGEFPRFAIDVLEMSEAYEYDTPGCCATCDDPDCEKN